MKPGKTLKRVDKVLVKAGVRIEQAAAALEQAPEDAEALHQYRISIRVARSLLRFAAPYMKKGRAKELDRKLKKLQDPTSTVRELDMLVAHLQELADSGDMQGLAGEEALQAALASATEARDEARAAFSNGFAAPKSAARRERICAELASVPWRKRVRKAGLDQKALVQRVSTLDESCRRDLESIDPGDIEAVHDVRKRAKAVRYITREFASVLPKQAALASGEMKAVQDKLGDMLDAHVNAQLLRHICGLQAEGLAQLFDERALQIQASLKA